MLHVGTFLEREEEIIASLRGDPSLGISGGCRGTPPPLEIFRINHLTYVSRAKH